MAEEKKKATTKATTTKKKATTKAKAEDKKNSPLTTDFSNISPELMQQMFAVFQAMQEQNKVAEKVETAEEVVEKPKKITKAYLKTIKDVEVNVRSVYGTVIHVSPKTGYTYKWMEIGDEEIMTVDEILAMHSSSTKYLTRPWVMVDNEDVIEGLGLTELYSVISKISDVDKLLDMEFYEIEKLIERAPEEHKKTLAGEIFRKVNNGEIKDIVLIRGLEKVLGTTLLL